jgi:site-specific recombinase XerD
VRRLGLRVGKWATADEATALLQAPDASSVKGKRDRAILAVLIGCALRRGELVGLTVADLEQRDGRAVFVDISGKGGRIRTVPVPDWCRTAPKTRTERKHKDQQLRPHGSPRCQCAI